MTWIGVQACHEATPKQLNRSKNSSDIKINDGRSFYWFGCSTHSTKIDDPSYAVSLLYVQQYVHTLLYSYTLTNFPLRRFILRAHGCALRDDQSYFRLGSVSNVTSSQHWTQYTTTIKLCEFWKIASVGTMCALEGKITKITGLVHETRYSY